MTHKEEIQTANTQKLAKTLEKFTYGGYDPWAVIFDEKFCKKCPTTIAKPDGYNKEYGFHECDFVDGKCPHGDMIEWWLEQEAETTQYIIENITHKNGETRTDDRYPQRIGSTVWMYPPSEGSCLVLAYIKDNKGNDKDGYIRTSTVEKYTHKTKQRLYVVETLNSIFYLRECE